MNKFFLMFLMLCCFFSPVKAQQSTKSNMFGVMGGVFLTSNPDMDGYNTKKNYTDGGGGFVYDYRNDVSDNYTFELISSLMLASSSTSKTEDGEDKLKVTFPIEGRWYLGNKDFKIFLGAGLQYNFIWSLKSVETEGHYDTYYDPWYGYWNEYHEGESDVDMGTGAHQLSANGSVGFSLFGPTSWFHLLLGAKFHFPIINNAEGIEYSKGGRIDFSKDKTCVTATCGVSFTLGGRDWRTDYYKPPVLMINYDYPLGGNKQTEVNGNFFQMHSQSITMSLLFKI